MLVKLSPGVLESIHRLAYIALFYHAGVAHVRYKSASSAIFAKQKLNGFEYAPNYPLEIRLQDEEDAIKIG